MTKLQFTKEQISESYQWLAAKMLSESDQSIDSHLLVLKYERRCGGNLFGSIRPRFSVFYQTKDLKFANSTFLNMQAGIYIPPVISKSVKKLVMCYNKELLSRL